MTRSGAQEKVRVSIEHPQMTRPQETIEPSIRHQLGPSLRYVENLATHAGTTIIVDDQSLLQRSSAVVMSPLIRHLWLMLQFDIADAYLCRLAPHDRTMARFSIQEPRLCMVSCAPLVP
jgi:hypothetical protein